MPRAHATLAAYLRDTDTTQRQLAKKLDSTQSAVSMWVTGQRVPRPETAMKIHLLTRVPLARLLQRHPTVVRGRKVPR
jgi:predicted transcriptional regulator